MRIIADLHIHSRFSRACSPKLNLSSLEKWASFKGINLITTADFTHPKWIKECEDQLESCGNGLYKIKGSKKEVFFIFTTEISFIYKKGDKTRRVHEVVLAPGLEEAKKLNKELNKRGFNLSSDGRPILGMSDRDFLELIKSIDKGFEIIPAHIWTPWYALFGSKSGFDSIKECFGDMSKYIFALETGLSSDPPMNWRLSDLDDYTLVSNSDSHSLKNIGREANVLEVDENKLSYDEIIDILKKGDKKRFLYTVEFFPEEGRYHMDGHRKCDVCFNPKKTIKEKGICPKCGKKLTIGVSHRVNDLADRDLGFKPKKAHGFKKLIQLDKIIAESIGLKTRNSKKVMKIYRNMIKGIGSEFYILLNAPIKKIKENVGHDKIIEAIKRVRNGNLLIKPGFDGSYGKVKIFKDNEKNKSKQKDLF
ncbi:MAG TPA: endonuclease Q family protein [Patescibacteria group bacterium]|nr:endonuclease Q family protein [Patescibacteria group bacterium]